MLMNATHNIFYIEYSTNVETTWLNNLNLILENRQSLNVNHFNKKSYTCYNGRAFIQINESHIPWYDNMIEWHVRLCLSKFSTVK